MIHNFQSILLVFSLAICQLLPYQHLFKELVQIDIEKSVEVAGGTVSPKPVDDCCATACEPASESNNHKSCCCYPSDSSTSQDLADDRSTSGKKSFVYIDAASCSPNDQFIQDSILVFSSQSTSPVQLFSSHKHDRFNRQDTSSTIHSFSPHQNTAKSTPFYIKFESYLC